MPQIRRGIRIDDDDAPPIYEKQTLDANRKKSNFQKDMDDLLFGGGMKPIPRGQPKQQLKPIIKQQPAKLNVTQPVKQPVKLVKPVDVVKAKVQQKVQSRIDVKPVEVIKVRVQQKLQSRIDVKPRPQQRKPAKIQEKPLPAGNHFNLTKSIVVNSSIQNKRSVQPAKEPASLIIEERVVEQPKQHQQPQIQVELKVEIQSAVYDRPVYIRKLKQIAQQFNFSSQNTNNHIAIDVVRPFECDRSRITKLNDYDFNDHQFPATSYSLGYSLRSTPSEWKRHNQTVKSSVLGKYIDPNDINPGKFSSPQFLSTLSSLAENQANIKRLIQDQKTNANGFYYVRLNINGVWRYIAVDNKLPFLNGQALGAQSFNDNESELWAALIEKAYAKVYSEYDVFNRTVPRQSYLRDLTGAPVRKYLVTEPELSDIIRSAISAGQAVLAVPRQQVLTLGLNPNHSFPVVKCKPNGSLELRNSWGSLQQRAKLTISKEGIFQLSSNQKKELISHIMIAYTNNSYSSSTIQSKHKTGLYSTFSFRVKNDAHGFLTVSQWDERLFPLNAYEYSPIRFILQKKNADDTSTYVNAGYSSSRNLDVEVNLLAGDYEIFVAGHWKSRQYDCDLTFFGQQKIQFKRNYSNKFPNIISQALTKLNLQTGKRSALGHCQQFIQHHKDSNLVLVTADNTSDKDYLFNQDFSKVNWNTLLLLNAKNNEQTYENLTESEIEEHKNSANQNRKWAVSIEPKGQFTWIISCGQDFDPQNFRKWGFK